MPIAPSRRTEIQSLIARLAAPDSQNAGAAAARLLVIGSPAFPSLTDAFDRADEGESGERLCARIARVLGLMRDRRTIAALGRIVTGGAPLRAVLAAQVLAAFRQPAAVRALGQGSAREEAGVRRAIVVSLRSLMDASVSGAREACLVARQRAPLEDDVIAGDLALLEALLADLSDMRVCASTGAAPNRPSLDLYLDLEPDSPEERALRKSVARGTPVEQLRGRLADERRADRLSLLALVAAETADVALIPPLWNVVKEAQKGLEASGGERASLIALSARAHLALAAQGSRVAAVELRALLADLGDELRVEHLRAVELIGGKGELRELVLLSGRPGWIGDAAFRVLCEIVGREGISPRSPHLRGLSDARRRALRQKKSAS